MTQDLSREGQTDFKLCFKQLSFVKGGPKGGIKKKKKHFYHAHDRANILTTKVTPFFLSLALLFVLSTRGCKACLVSCLFPVCQFHIPGEGAGSNLAL